MKPPTPKARALLTKLEALAERGINGEQQVARRKLARLRKRFDFAAPDTGGSDVFAGVFLKSTIAAPVYRFDPGDWDVANGVKWAIEAATPIRCLFRGGELLAEAAPATANRLHDIAGKLSADFTELWTKFHAAGGDPQDRGNFLLGLWDGLMDVRRENTPLPSKSALAPRGRRRKGHSVASLPGLSVHPYSVALVLGRKIRFSVPMSEIAGELETVLRPQITA